jgi:hypothetical protein
MLDQVDESELNGPIASQLAEVRRHLESSLWACEASTEMARNLAAAGLDRAEQARQFQASLPELARKCDAIWGKP